MAFESHGTPLELWKVANGESEIVASLGAFHFGQPELVAMNGDLFFADGVGNLWRHRASSIPSTQVVHSFPNPDQFEGDRPAITDLVVRESRLFFVANDGTHGREIWTTDGTSEGTKLAADIRPGANGARPDDLIISDEHLYFTANDGEHGRELWRIDLESPIPGDIDGNDIVDFEDFFLLSRNFGQTVAGGAADGDLDEDGRVDFKDFLLFAADFGKQR